MKPDIMERLRTQARTYSQMWTFGTEMLEDAADEIEELRGKLSAIYDAVEWAKECEDFRWVGRERLSFFAIQELYETYHASRASVARLVANESAADCKGEG